MPTDETNRELAAALLEAEVTHDQALAKHEAERTELSRRVLDEARQQLDAIERRAKAVGKGEWTWAPVNCECGGRPKAERWIADGFRETEGEGVTVRAVGDVPQWAAPYALQGVSMVTRYECSKCGQEIAVLARDVD